MRGIEQLALLMTARNNLKLAKSQMAEAQADQARRDALAELQRRVAAAESELAKLQCEFDGPAGERSDF